MYTFLLRMSIVHFFADVEWIKKWRPRMFAQARPPPKIINLYFFMSTPQNFPSGADFLRGIIVYDERFKNFAI